jgi:hypothetical protein
MGDKNYLCHFLQFTLSITVLVSFSLYKKRMRTFSLELLSRLQHRKLLWITYIIESTIVLVGILREILAQDVDFYNLIWQDVGLGPMSGQDQN